jgi:hypothetical protein
MTAMAVLLLSGELAAPAITRTFLGALTPKTTLAASFTWSAQDLGAADAGRWIIATINYRPSGAEDTVTSVTIGGVTATLAKIQHNSGECGAVIAVANVPTGTTGDVVVTSGGEIRRLGGGLIRAIGLQSGTPDDTAGVSSATGEDPAITIDTYSGGLIVGTQWYSSSAPAQRSSGASAETASTLSAVAVSVENGADNAAWSGITEDYDQLITSSSATGQAAAFASWAP